MQSLFHADPVKERPPSTQPRHSRTRGQGLLWGQEHALDPARPDGSIAPIPAVRVPTIGGLKSTQSGRSPALLDNLVGAGEERLRHGEAERVGCVQIDDQLEGRRLLDRHLGGLGAFEDLSRVSADEAKGRR
jgi:hypothetical protein